jgi:hypothetical protein
MKADIENACVSSGLRGRNAHEHMAHFLRSNTERRRRLSTNGTAGSAMTYYKRHAHNVKEKQSKRKGPQTEHGNEG